jgi:SpoVK/Ycf46/Vps4 family AAA+-type ATPase
MFDNDVSLDELAEATDGMSGADINEILRRVRFDHAMQEAQAKQAMSPITQQDIIDVIQDMRTS